MTDTLRIEVPLAPVSGNRRNRMHWRTRARIAEAWRIAVLATVNWKDTERLHCNSLEEQPRKVKVSVTCCCGGKRGVAELDHDNLISGLKPAYDALVRANLLKSDSPKHIVHGTVEQIVERDPSKHRTVFVLELL